MESRAKIIKVHQKITGVHVFDAVPSFLIRRKMCYSFCGRELSRGFLMFDDDEIDGFSAPGFQDDDLDDFDYYVSYIKALEKEDFSKSDIAREIMDEFDLEKDEAVRIVKRYFAEKENFSDDDDGEDDIVEDDDYSDGNSTEY